MATTTRQRESLTVRTRLKPSKPVTSPKRSKTPNPPASPPIVDNPSPNDGDSDYDADESRVGRKSRLSPRTPTNTAVKRNTNGTNWKDTYNRPTLVGGEGLGPRVARVDTVSKAADTSLKNREEYTQSFLDFSSLVSSCGHDTTGDKADTKQRHLSLETDTPIEKEALPDDEVEEEVTPKTGSGRYKACSGFRTEDVPDLSGFVIRATSRPVFEGTYSTVYRGEYLNEQVAIKIIRSVNPDDKSMNRKIRRELETWWRLNHSNILPLYGYVVTEDFGVFGAMVSPWCGQGTATEYLATEVTATQRVNLFRDVAEGINYLHTFTPIVAHGDLKPGNVLIDDACVGKLCDFGLVRLIHDQIATGMTTTTAHTGTARYLAYELIASDEEPRPTTASDVHALGCVGMEFIYSQPPYSHIQALHHRAHFKICQEISNRVPPATRPPNTSRIISELWDVFESCWKLEPENRPTAEVIRKYLHERAEEIVSSLG